MGKFKRIVALLMVIVMCISVVGCSKKKKSEKKEEKLDTYAAKVLATIDKSLSQIIIEGDVIYGSYYDYDEAADTVEYGLVKYNMETGEQKTAVIGNGEESVSSMYVDADNNLVLKLNRYVELLGEDNTDSETYAYEETQIKAVYSENLEQISYEEGEKKVHSSENDNEDAEWEMGSVVDKEGNTYTIMSKEESSYILIKDSEGNETGRIEDLGEESVDMIDDISLLEDGTVIVSVYSDGVAIYKLDVEKCKIGDKIAEFKGDYPNGISLGTDGNLLVNAGGYLYRCDIQSGKTSKVLKYMTSDINPDDVSMVFQRENDEYGVIIVDYENNTTEIDILTKVDKSEVSNKQEIHLAVFGADSDIQDMVIKYNKTSPNYRIVIDDYWDDNTEYDDAINKFNAALSSGDAPDIIDLSSVNVPMYSKKGVLEDLTPYLDKDSEISAKDFVQSVINAYKVDDKIYGIPVSFSIGVLTGATSKVGSDTSWSMKEFVELAQSLPAGTEILNNITSDGLLYSILYWNMNHYVDWSKGTCNFNNDDFIELLEFCSKYESSEEFYEDYDYDKDTSEITKIRNNQLLLREESIDGVEQFLLSKLIFGEEVTYKGYPTSEGSGVVAQDGGSKFGISAKSKYKEEAWNFIRSFYTKEYQDKYLYWNFPIRQDSLDEMLEKAKTDTFTAQNGQQIIGSWSIDDIDLDIPAPSDDDIANLKRLIDAIDSGVQEDTAIFDMVQEEAKAFFEGQKTASEVADVVQSRVSVYVKENS